MCRQGRAIFFISEAASSKFLSVGGFVGDDTSIGESGGQRNMPSLSSRMTSEDVTKALGMPHSLCRSCTIEVGPFVNQMQACLDQGMWMSVVLHWVVTILLH